MHCLDLSLSVVRCNNEKTPNFGFTESSWLRSFGAVHRLGRTRFSHAVLPKHGTMTEIRMIEEVNSRESSEMSELWCKPRGEEYDNGRES